MKIKLSMATWSRIRGLDFKKPKDVQYEKVGDIYSAYHSGKQCTQIDGEWYSMEERNVNSYELCPEQKEAMVRAAIVTGVSASHAMRAPEGVML